MRRQNASFILGLASLVIHGLVQCNGRILRDDAPLPNPDCMYFPFDTTLLCPSGMTIPGNFDVSKIRKDVQQITINGPARNVLRSDALPLPADLTNLTQIIFNGFTDENNSRILIKRFVDNVKGHLTSLGIANSKVGFLEDGFLQGFSQLEELNFAKSDISSISRTALQRDGSTFLSVSLLENQLETIDWAVFQPLSQTLTALQIDSQRPGLKSISCSSSFRFANALSSLQLGSNQLESLPQCVLDSLNYNTNSHIGVDNNAFCPTDGACTCPAVQPFLGFACAFSAVNPGSGLSFKCGTGPNQRSWNLQQMPPDAPCTSGVPSFLQTSWLILIAVTLSFFTLE
ncbi:uncharacterized protein LOC129590870 [Paramacrobiotus metropolitanus]|uniref:uncharacterized protein LOC129590870 n=1 Tax=Paramacrobiotus metropolitanus TaxID=2943436 RepID=UPI00244568BA|nr:uncharacterized protein LOC129590870 [Paramacrobiotus metropolitanus]